MEAGVVAAATAERSLIDTVEAEYEAYCAGGRSLHYVSIAVRGGEVQYCGSRGDPSRWTVAFVRAAERVVVPLAVGEFQRVADRHRQLREADVPLWDSRLFPPPFARIGGKSYLFKPGHGSVLVGVVETNECTVLLAADGPRLVVIYRAGKSRITLPVGEPQNFREVDVDSLLKVWPQAMPKTGSVEPPPKLQAHYIRLGKLILRGDQFVLDGRTVRLGDISCPVLNIYTETDHIIPPAMSRALRGRVGSEDFTEVVLKGGHIGIFVSARALEQLANQLLNK